MWICGGRPGRGGGTYSCVLGGGQLGVGGAKKRV